MDSNDISTVGLGDGCLTQRVSTPSSSNIDSEVLDALNLSLSSIIGCVGIIDNLLVFVTMATSKKMRSKVRLNSERMQNH